MYRAERVDTTYAPLDLTRMRGVNFQGNTYHNIVSGGGKTRCASSIRRNSPRRDPGKSTRSTACRSRATRWTSKGGRHPRSRPPQHVERVQVRHALHPEREGRAKRTRSILSGTNRWSAT